MYYDHFQKIDQTFMATAVNAQEPYRAALAAAREHPGFEDYLALLSPAATGCLDAMALRARALTRQHFGRTIGLFIPLYLSNECSNECVYCGFNRRNRIQRRTLSEPEVERELAALADQGFDSILLLTGEAPAKAGLDYLARCVALARRRFNQVALEVYPLDTDGYRRLVEVGATGLTMFQETYDPAVYAQVHRAGRKADFRWRLEAPDRAALAGFRRIGIGALLGLAPWRMEAAHLGAHAAYLMKEYWRTEVSVSFPRLRECPSAFQPQCLVSDRELVQMLFALRIYTRVAGITLSTRESPWFRDHMVSLGVTHMSAGSRTNPGGYRTYSEQESQGQFEISDDRGLAEVLTAIRAQGSQPVFRDWAASFGGLRP